MFSVALADVGSLIRRPQNSTAHPVLDVRLLELLGLHIHRNAAKRTSSSPMAVVPVVQPWVE